MKFRKNGKVFDTIAAATNEFCNLRNCECAGCPVKDWHCLSFACKHPKEAAAMMGFETIENQLTKNELEICKVLCAKWISCDNNLSGITLWKEKPEYNHSFCKFMAKSDYSIANISSEYFPSVKSGDCINVEDFE